MDIVLLISQVVLMLVCIWLGARAGGIALGFWGGVGVFVMAFVFRAAPADPPIDVMLIILAVICATAVMQAAGGIDFMVGIAQRIIRRYPNRIVFVGPLVAWLFTFAAGTGHILYQLLPVIHETARKNGIRPERAMSVAVIASMHGITASPVSAAMAALIVVLDPMGVGMPTIMAIAVPSTLIGILAASAVMLKKGKELEDDPEFQRRVAAGMVEDIPEIVKASRRAKREGITVTQLLEREGRSAADISRITATATIDETHLPKGERPEDLTAAANGARPGSARIATAIFLTAVVAVVLLGAFPTLRPTDAEGSPLGMAVIIEILMLAAAAIMTTVTGVKVDAVAKSSIARTGLIAVVGICGIAWLGLTVIETNQEVIVNGLTGMVTDHPWTFAVGLFFASILLFSQASTTRTLMPLGASLGLSATALVGMWPAVNGAFFLPTYGTLVAAMNFDLTGTTKIGKYVLNHSFMRPGVTAAVVSVSVGLLLSTVIH